MTDILSSLYKNAPKKLKHTQTSDQKIDRNVNWVGLCQSVNNINSIRTRIVFDSNKFDKAINSNRLMNI